MTDINSVVEFGRITKDLDEKSYGTLPGGTAKAKVSIAVNRSRKQGEEWVEEVSYFDVDIFGKMAEILKPRLVKGAQIAVKGYLKQDRWKDKEGHSRSAVYIVADSVQILNGTKKTEDGSGSTEAPAEYNPQEDFGEDIPF